MLTCWCHQVRAFYNQLDQEIVEENVIIEKVIEKLVDVDANYERPRPVEQVDDAGLGSPPLLIARQPTTERNPSENLTVSEEPSILKKKHEEKTILTGRYVSPDDDAVRRSNSSVIKKRRGRPKGSKNKKPRTGSSGRDDETIIVPSISASETSQSAPVAKPNLRQKRFSTG